MPQRAKESPADRTFGALSNPTRRDILDLLLEGPHSVADIASRFEMARPSVSEHLEVLRDAGLVTVTKRGRFRYYQVEPEPLHELQQWLTPYERFWRDRMAALGDVLDDLDTDSGGAAAAAGSESPGAYDESGQPDKPGDAGSEHPS